jgi:hypothetical protein
MKLINFFRDKLKIHAEGYAKGYQESTLFWTVENRKLSKIHGDDLHKLKNNHAAELRVCENRVVQEYEKMLADKNKEVILLREQIKSDREGLAYIKEFVPELLDCVSVLHIKAEQKMLEHAREFQTVDTTKQRVEHVQRRINSALPVIEKLFRLNELS